jgi:hypothetical protein
MDSATPQRRTRDREHQNMITPAERAGFEHWEKDWQERFENPDAWERGRYEKLRAARLVREAQEAECRAAWAALVRRPPWKRNSFSLDEASMNVRVPSQTGFDDIASDRILVELFALVLLHHFDGNVLIWTDEPSHLIPFDPEKARWVQEAGHDVDARALRTLGFAGSLFLTRAVLKRWCEHTGLVMPPGWISEDTDLPNGLTEEPDHEDDAAVILATQDEKIEPKRPGPKKGTGRFVAADCKLFPDITKLVGDGMSIHGAVTQISDRISGGSQLDSRIRRVERRYRKET